MGVHEPEPTSISERVERLEKLKWVVATIVTILGGLGIDITISLSSVKDRTQEVEKYVTGVEKSARAIEADLKKDLKATAEGVNAIKMELDSAGGRIAEQSRNAVAGALSSADIPGQVRTAVGQQISGIERWGRTIDGLGNVAFKSDRTQYPTYKPSERTQPNSVEATGLTIAMECPSTQQVLVLFRAGYINFDTTLSVDVERRLDNTRTEVVTTIGTTTHAKETNSLRDAIIIGVAKLEPGKYYFKVKYRGNGWGNANGDVTRNELIVLPLPAPPAPPAPAPTAAAAR